MFKEGFWWLKLKIQKNTTQNLLADMGEWGRNDLFDYLSEKGRFFCLFYHISKIFLPWTCSYSHDFELNQPNTRILRTDVGEALWGRPQISSWRQQKRQWLSLCTGAWPRHPWKGSLCGNVSSTRRPPDQGAQWTAHTCLTRNRSVTHSPASVLGLNPQAPLMSDKCSTSGLQHKASFILRQVLVKLLRQTWYHWTWHENKSSMLTRLGRLTFWHWGITPWSINVLGCSLQRYPGV